MKLAELHHFPMRIAGLNSVLVRKFNYFGYKKSIS